MELKDIFTAAGSTNPTMLRTFRRKKKFIHNSVEQKNSDSGMDKNPYVQSTFVRWERILGKIPHGSNYSSTEYHKRLAGGADKDLDGGNKSISSTRADKLPSTSPPTRLEMPQIRENQVSSHDHSNAISEKNVDEIIDCAIQNLQEAGKALASLGENHERELKLMVMDVLAKFQKWIDVVQKKMDAAGYDVNSIRKALAEQTIVLTAKDRELAELQAKLAECEANNTAYKKALAETQSEVESQSISQVPTAPYEAVAVLNGEHAEPQTTVSFAAAQENGQEVHVGKDMPVSRLSSWATIARKLSRSQTRVPGSVARIPSSSQIGLDGNQSALDSVSIPGQTDLPQPTSEQSHASATPIEQHPELSPNVDPPVISAGTMTVISTSPHTPSAVPLVSDQDNEQEHDGRVVALEAELTQLRSENERMKRDHAEYGNEVQRALLQGVSSLNAEALKVLRNPPFICYKPCEPCNPSESSGDMMENVPCALKTTNNRVSQRGGKSSSCKVGAICQTHESGVHSSSRKQAASVCYAPAKKSSQNSMLFLLPQEHIGCACTAVVQEYCVGTNYGRAGRKFPRERVYCTSRVTAGRDGFRGGLMRTYTRALDRCEPLCHRNRRFIID